jgi:hypothetical protein
MYMTEKSRAEVKRMEAPSLSAIMVIPGNFAELERTLRHLEAQTVAHQIEIVCVVDKRDQIPAERLKPGCFHSWSVVEVEKIKSIGQGFTAGILKAQAPIVALTEDHSFPDTAWAETFIRRHRENWDIVGPSMRNQNPVNTISRADFYQAYGGWAQPVKSGSPAVLPGHNSSYKRDILLALGADLEVYMEAESVMHRYLGQHGHTLWLAAETCTAHYNFDSWQAWIPSRYYTGRQYAAVWSHSWPFARRCLYTLGSPLIPLIRLRRIEKEIRKREPLRIELRLLPTIIAGLVVESFGQMTGYAAGAGNAAEKAAQYEFHRITRKAES